MLRSVLRQICQSPLLVLEYTPLCTIPSCEPLFWESLPSAYKGLQKNILLQLLEQEAELTGREILIRLLQWYLHANKLIITTHIANNIIEQGSFKEKKIGLWRPTTQHLDEYFPNRNKHAIFVLSPNGKTPIHRPSQTYIKAPSLSSSLCMGMNLSVPTPMPRRERHPAVSALMIHIFQAVNQVGYTTE